jgi:hypothetical protein
MALGHVPFDCAVTLRFFTAWPEWCLAIGFIVGVAISVFAYMYDQLRKTTVLFYDFDDQMMACYQQLHDSGAKLASCSKVWHIEASGAVYDPKYHAGAGNLLRRKVTSISKSKPPLLKQILRRLLSMSVAKHYIFSR